MRLHRPSWLDSSRGKPMGHEIVVSGGMTLATALSEAIATTVDNMGAIVADTCLTSFLIIILLNLLQ